MKSFFSFVFVALFLSLTAAPQRTNASIRIENVIVTPEKGKKITFDRSKMELVFYSDMARNERSSIKLYDDFENRSIGFWYTAYPVAFAANQLLQTDFRIQLNVPGGGAFLADGKSGKGGGGFSVKKTIRAEKNSLCEVFKLADGKVFLPVIYAKLPRLEKEFSPALLKYAEVEVKIIAIRSAEIKKITGRKEIEDFLIQQDATRLGEKAKAEFTAEFLAKDGKASFRKMTPAPKKGIVRGNHFGLQIELAEVDGALRITMDYTRLAGQRKNGSYVAEYFEMDGVTSMRDGLWHIPVRVRAFRGGKHASFESERNLENPLERLILIRITKKKNF